MTPDDYEKLPPEEKEHFARCTRCGKLSAHKIGNQATQSRIAWLPEEHNLMGIVVFGEMLSRSFYGLFDMKLPKTCSRRKETLDAFAHV